MLVILAHVGPPVPIMFLRCFDVPLLVLISGILANDSLERIALNKEKGYDSHSYLTYISKRFMRLVLPAWIMLVLFFACKALAGTVYTPKYYLESFLLTRYGIGYVWIVLIFFYCALVAPFIKRFLHHRLFWLVMALVYCIYEVALHYHLGRENVIILNTVYYIIPYGLLTGLGMKYLSMTKQTKIIICVAGFILFVASGIFYYYSRGSIQLPTINKYPPRIYFLSYSVALSFLLLLLCEGKDNSFFRCRPVQFISSHSLWIYLWHIFYLMVSYKFSLIDNWVLRYGFVTALSIATVWLQNFFFDKLETEFNWSVPKYLRG